MRGGSTIQKIEELVIKVENDIVDLMNWMWYDIVWYIMVLLDEWFWIVVYKINNELDQEIANIELFEENEPVEFGEIVIA